MKRIMLIAFMLLLLAAANSGAYELAVDDTYYVGRIVDGIPPDGQAIYLANLIDTSKVALGSGPVTIGTESYYRSNLVVPTTLTGFTDNLKVDLDEGQTTNPAFSGGFIMGKYDQDRAGTYVWFVDFSQSYFLPEVIDQYGLSNYHTWGSPEGYFPTPEPGSLLLLGLGLIGIGAVARSKIKK